MFIMIYNININIFFRQRLLKKLFSVTIYRETGSMKLLSDVLIYFKKISWVYYHLNLKKTLQISQAL